MALIHGVFRELLDAAEYDMAWPLKQRGHPRNGSPATMSPFPHLVSSGDYCGCGRVDVHYVCKSPC